MEGAIRKTYRKILVQLHVETTVKITVKKKNPLKMSCNELFTIIYKTCEQSLAP